MTTRNARLSELLIKPLVTEKATSLVAENQYTFKVLPEANKIELTQAFELMFPGRKVLKIQTTKIYPQQKRVGRRTGQTPVGKKAIFTIQGDPIELFTGV
jgi:large subunit ribosomal protein L23